MAGNSDEVVNLGQAAVVTIVVDVVNDFEVSHGVANQVDRRIVVLAFQREDHVLDVVSTVLVTLRIILFKTGKLVILQVDFHDRVSGVGGDGSVEGDFTMPINVSPDDGVGDTGPFSGVGHLGFGMGAAAPAVNEDCRGVTLHELLGSLGPVPGTERKNSNCCDNDGANGGR